MKNRSTALLGSAQSGRTSGKAVVLQVSIVVWLFTVLSYEAVRTYSRLTTPPTVPVAQFTNNARYLVLSESGEITVLSCVTGDVLLRFPPGFAVFDCARHDFGVVASEGKGTSPIYLPGIRESCKRIPPLVPDIQFFALSPAERKLLLVNGDGVPAMVDLLTWSTIWRGPAVGTKISSVAISAGGEVAIGGPASGGHLVQLIASRDGTAAGHIIGKEHAYVDHLAFSKDGSHLAVSLTTPSVYVYETNSLRQIFYSPLATACTALQFDAVSDRLLVSTHERVEIIDVAQGGETVNQVRLHADSVTAAWGLDGAVYCFLSDGSLVRFMSHEAASAYTLWQSSPEGQFDVSLVVFLCWLAALGLYSKFHGSGKGVPSVAAVHLGTTATLSFLDLRLLAALPELIASDAGDPIQLTLSLAAIAVVLFIALAAVAVVLVAFKDAVWLGMAATATCVFTCACNLYVVVIAFSDI